MDLTLQRGARPVRLDRIRYLFFDMAATWLLHKRFGPTFLTQLYSYTDGDLELLSPEALEFFLYAGLQADAKQHGEELSFEQSSALLTPVNYREVFREVVLSVIGVTATPVLPGKRVAAAKAAKPTAARPAAKHPGPTKASTMTKRSATPTRSSTGRRRSSGR